MIYKVIRNGNAQQNEKINIDIENRFFGRHLAKKKSKQSKWNVTSLEDKRVLLLLLLWFVTQETISSEGMALLNAVLTFVVPRVYK